MPKKPATPVTRRGFKFNETAKMLGISENALRRLVARGEAKVTYLGPRLPIFSSAEVDRLLGGSARQ